MLSDSRPVACQRRARWLQLSITVCSTFVDHLELCAMRCFRRPPAPRHSTPPPFGTPRRSEGKDEPDGVPDE